MTCWSYKQHTLVGWGLGAKGNADQEEKEQGKEVPDGQKPTLYMPGRPAAGALSVFRSETHSI